MKRKLKPFDKYWYYSNAVQSPDADVDFLKKTFRYHAGRPAKYFREDFCGTFLNLCTWVKLNKDHHGVGIDLDPEPLDYGRKHYLAKLTPDEQKRIHLHQANVLSARVEPADVIAAMNFSYCIFKERKDLYHYIQNCRRGLKKNGILMMDAFGGHGCLEKNTDKKRRRGYWYHWEQTDVDPITHEGKFYIHFKRDGEKERKNVFTYDWRIWSLPEIQDLMHEAGFRDVVVYWEKSNSRGGGSGEFVRSKKGESCASWIAYVVGVN